MFYVFLSADNFNSFDAFIVVFSVLELTAFAGNVQDSRPLLVTGLIDYKSIANVH